MVEFVGKYGYGEGYMNEAFSSTYYINKSFVKGKYNKIDSC